MRNQTKKQTKREILRKHRVSQIQQCNQVIKETQLLCLYILVSSAIIRECSFSVKDKFYCNILLGSTCPTIPRKKKQYYCTCQRRSSQSQLLKMMDQQTNNKKLCMTALLFVVACTALLLALLGPSTMFGTTAKSSLRPRSLQSSKSGTGTPTSSPTSSEEDLLPQLDVVGSGQSGKLGECYGGCNAEEVSSFLLSLLTVSFF